MKIENTVEIKIDKHFKVQSNKHLRIRENHSLDSKTVGFLYNNDIIKCDIQYGYWFHHDNGWSISFNISDGNMYLVECTDDDLLSNNTRSIKHGAKLSRVKNPNLRAPGDDEDDDDLENYTDFSDIKPGPDRIRNPADYLLSRDINGVFGVPYQFPSNVDQPIGKTRFGRKYAEKIIAPMPIVFLTPGRPAFMKSFDSDSKQNVLDSITSIGAGRRNDAQIDEIIEGYGRYYTFKFAYDEYYKYVNDTLHHLATYMGIGDKRVTIGKESARLDRMRWERTLSPSFEEFISAAEAIPFYVNSDTSVSESFSNSTTESMLAQKANSLSDIAKEAMFILGDVKDATLVQGVAGVGEGLQDVSETLIGGVSGMLLGDAGKNFIQRISSSFSTIVTGGKLDFPEIWQDSDFSRSYSIEFKFRSPDADNLSIFLNLYVPLIHLICLGAPQQMGANAYGSPFIVRGFYKGIFNCDYGIVTGLDITKGKEGCWNANGLPTVIDVTLNLKELYNTFYISNSADSKYINNTALIDYLLLMAGVNINKPELVRTIETYIMNLTNNTLGAPGDIWLGLQTDLSNLISSYYKVK